MPQLASKLRDLVSIDATLARATSLTPAERAALWGRRYAAVARRRNSMTYLGHAFHYDNPFTPILLGAYPREAERLVRLFAPARVETVLDIGANLGQFAVSLAHAAPGARGWSFEPNPKVLPLLRENTAHLTSWQVVSSAVSATAGPREFWSVPDKSAQGSFVRDNSESGMPAAAEALSVQAGPLDADARAALGIPDRVDLVKIDVEGAEADAIHGIASLDWTWMALEVSTGERQGIALRDAIDLVTSLWRAPDVLWTSTPPPGAIAQDVVLRLPAATDASLRG